MKKLYLLIQNGATNKTNERKNITIKKIVIVIIIYEDNYEGAEMCAITLTIITNYYYNELNNNLNIQ